MRLLIIFAVLCVSCSGKPEDLKDSIIDTFGPASVIENAKYYRIEYTPNDDSYFEKSSGIKKHIDKELSMLPTNVSEGQNLESTIYDHYEWETPSYLLTLENSVIDIKTSKYRIALLCQYK